LHIVILFFFTQSAQRAKPAKKNSNVYSLLVVSSPTRLFQWVKTPTDRLNNEQKVEECDATAAQ